MAQTLKLKVIGGQTMHCAGCERTVKFTLSHLLGVREVRTDRKTQTIGDHHQKRQGDRLVTLLYRLN